MRWEFHPEALEEYGHAARYYAARDPALALEFIAAVEDAIARIIEGPERWAPLEADIRRRLTRVFPYGILYVIEPAGIVILAVMHLSREPGYWRSRLTGRDD